MPTIQNQQSEDKNESNGLTQKIGDSVVKWPWELQKLDSSVKENKRKI